MLSNISVIFRALPTERTFVGFTSGSTAGGGPALGNADNTKGLFGIIAALAGEVDLSMATIR